MTDPPSIDRDQISRPPIQIGRRVLILGTMSLRASLEVTDDSRCPDYCRRLLPWLIEVGCGEELTQIEEAILASPWRDVSESQRIDLNWAGESAWYLAATLGWNSCSPWQERVAPYDPVSHFGLLKKSAIERVVHASFVDARESARMARISLAIRFRLQQHRVPEELRAQLATANNNLLAESGIEVSCDEENDAGAIVAEMTPAQRVACSAVYFCRYVASRWLLQRQERWLGAAD